MKNDKILKIIKFFITVIIIIITIIIVFFYKIQQESKNEEIKESTPDSISVTETNIVEGNTVDNSIINDNTKKETRNSTTNIQYIELNEENYEKYNSRVVKISDNKDGTYTIISRIYQEVTLPTLSKNEVESLENGNTVNVLNWTLKKDVSENYDNTSNLELISSIDEENWMRFYITKNSNGTASLSYYGEMTLGKPTHTYMRAIVNKTVFLDDEIQEYSSDEFSSEEIAPLVYSEDIGFENGKISSFSWTGN